MSLPMCSGAHCSRVSAQINQTCKKEGWPVGHLVMICNPSTGECCNCRCSCLAWGTEILIPDNQVKVIQDFVIGDPVMACGPDLKWEQKTVLFSDGTTAYSRQPMMLHLVYGKEDQELVVTMDHLFLVPGDKLKRADKLIVGQDFLISPEGEKVEIHSISVGVYQGGVHHIATSTGKPESLDGHLLDSQGVVSADYAVQIYYQHGELDADQFLVPNHEKIPQAEEQESKIPASDWKLGLTGTDRTATGFIPRSELMVNIPDRARKFFTTAQAHELGQNAPLYPKGYLENQQAVEYLFELFKTFYPQISFLPDFYRDDFNAYSWKEGDEMVVVVCGGITRVRSLELAGLALIIAHEVGHLLADPDLKGEVCEGNADYYAVQCVLRRVFYQDFFQLIYSGLLPQIKQTFSYITKHTGTDHSCNNLALDCRYKVYGAAGALENMPACAGGPGLLALEKAENTKDGLILTFNEILNAGTAQTVSNYLIKSDEGDLPQPKVTKATYSSKNPKKVILTVQDLVKGKHYLVNVSNLLSAEGEALNPAKSSAGFDA